MCTGGALTQQPASFEAGFSVIQTESEFIEFKTTRNSYNSRVPEAVQHSTADKKGGRFRRDRSMTPKRWEKSTTADLGSTRISRLLNGHQSRRNRIQRCSNTKRSCNTAPAAQCSQRVGFPCVLQIPPPAHEEAAGVQLPRGMSGSTISGGCARQMPRVVCK